MPAEPASIRCHHFFRACGPPLISNLVPCKAEVRDLHAFTGTAHQTVIDHQSARLRLARENLAILDLQANFPHGKKAQGKRSFGGESSDEIPATLLAESGRFRDVTGKGGSGQQSQQNT
ncbi:MAG: hypothetical protein ABSD96_19610 [Candidatus Korobacteraceae bacterium]